MKIFQPDSLAELFNALTDKGFEVVGPTVRNGAIVYDVLESPDELPMGWTDEQDGGSYRLVKRQDDAYFGFVVGSQSWKKFLFPPETRLFDANRSGAGFTVEPAADPDHQYAFFGVRACELEAIAIQDRVFLSGEHVDDQYKALRERIFVVAVNCTRAGGTCFCASVDTGPRVKGGYDLVLTEVLEGNEHIFVADSGTERGAEILAGITTREAEKKHLQAADAAINNAALHMGRALETEDLKELLYDNYEHPRWDDVGKRCLACGNCTMVCPTCFCSTVEDTNSIDGDHAERWRRWDSCFTTEFSYLHGGSMRRSSGAKYRQWMTHKLATWQDQFGVLGCVGCGRCITWCPVGIDITEEVRAIRATDAGPETRRAKSPRTDEEIKK
jgi:ferredoxin